MHREPSIRGCAWLCVLLLALAPASLAETFDVTSIDDDGASTLRSAIDDANGSVESDNSITFTLSEMDPTITLESNLADVANNILVLDGTGDDLSIDGGGFQILGVGENVEVIDIVLSNGTISIAAEKILTLDTPQNQTSSVAISGDGGLTKEGTGILFLTGNLTHTGVTTISEGTLALENVLAGDIVNDATLQLDLAAPETYSGVISGTGSLTKTGTAELFLDGLNTYSGATIVNEGTLTLAVVDDSGTNRFAIEGDVTIQTDGTLAFDFDDTTETFAGALSGAGILTKDGTGRLVLSGTHTGTGTAQLNQGQLEVSSRSLAGDVVVSDGSELVFSQGFDGTYAGDISSPGTGANLVKEGTGNLRLAGDNTMFLGAVQVTAGTLTGDATSLPADIRNDATLVFDQATDASYAGVVSSTGAVQKTGAATLTFTGAHTYTGPTTIVGGRLDVDGSLVSPLTIEAGGTLGGTGTLGAPVEVKGRIAPGNSVGTLTAIDDVTFTSESTLEIEIDSVPMVTRDLLVIAGFLDIEAGARIVPRFDDLAGEINDLLIVTSSGRNGEFEIDDDLAFQTVSLAHNAGNVTISVDFEDIFSGANTANQTAIATALDNASNDGSTTDALNDAIDSLLTSSLSRAEGARAIDEIGVEAVSQLDSARLALSQRLGDSTQQRIRNTFAGGASPLFGSVSRPAPLVASAAHARSLRGFDVSAGGFGAQSRAARVTTRGGLRSFEPEPGQLGLGGWLDGYGGYGSIDAQSGSADADYLIAGATLGLDLRLTPNVLVGLGGGWGFSDLEVDDRSADGDAHTFHGLAYGGYATPEFHVGLSGHYAVSEIETERRIAFATTSEKATGDFDGDAYGGRIEAGVNAAGLYGVLLQPIAHFDWSHIERDGFRESGSPSFATNVESESIDSQVTSLGLRLHGAWALPDDTGSFEPEIIARWEHQFGDDEREVTGTLLGDGSATPIALRGADAPTDRYLVHLGWVVSSEAGLRATLGYTGAFSSEQMEHGGALSLGYTW